MAYGGYDWNRRLGDYISSVADALNSQNGGQLSTLISVSRGSYCNVVAAGLDQNKGQDVNRLSRQLEKVAPLGEMLGQHMRCMQYFVNRRFVDSYNALEKSANAFLQEFRNWESAWAMKALHTVAYELRTIAEMADKEMASNGKIPDKLKGAGSFLMKVFGALAGKGPKRVGALYVTCQLFKIYFKLGTVHLCRSVIRSIETARVFDFEEFPIRDRVTYMYYTGRLEVFNDQFVLADQKLMYALVHCDPLKKNNIRMVLKYLIPVKLSLGVMPSKLLLERYGLLEYKEVIQALRTGDIRLLRQALQTNEDQFLRSGVYLVLEKLELQCYRRLMRKIHIIQKQKDPGRAHQVKMDCVLKALKWLNIEMDIDEVECIMAILIYRNYIKGYFSHKSKVVVLSKQDPFPALTAMT
ncbi:enhanced ethylene response protein 5 [Physcomitrium patens]|uniref:PCI domain-containing protein n=1 Tax=Physcomitrium patens TaxID=3218 RepID=A9TTD9_PHYPA|nr:enhanced ethylene response protein 5-like [Physcomitrium patens]PNR36134.1 hypothetical protein PHYPA_021985 [Physcomitrium patens]|eukprot:XP_024399951.1 enhanced ethylene response protein 5-like [Physcomitrella patens]